MIALKAQHKPPDKDKRQGSLEQNKLKKPSQGHDVPNYKVQFKFSHGAVMYATLGNSNFASTSSPSIAMVRVQRSCYTRLTVALLTFLWPLELWCLILRVCSVLLLLGLLC